MCLTRLACLSGYWIFFAFRSLSVDTFMKKSQRNHLLSKWLLLFVLTWTDLYLKRCDLIRVKDNDEFFVIQIILFSSNWFTALMFVIFSQVVNKVSSEQPLSLSIVRKKIEERFAKQNPPYNDNGEEFYRKMAKLPSVYYTPSTGEDKGKSNPTFILI